MAVGANLTSSAGVLALLSEPENEVRVFALRRLNAMVDDFWAEIAEFITAIEMLYEDAEFPERELSALVASKVYYHLGSYTDSLSFALGAGARFDVNGTSEYIETIISKCIDRYTELRVGRFDENAGSTIDPRLEAIVDRMFERCLVDRRYKQAVGVALETRRVDILERAIHEADDTAEMLTYCLKVTLSLISLPRFRNSVLELLVRLYQELAVPDYISVCQCYIFLDDPVSTAHCLEKLAKGESENDYLTAYQIAFDLYESATQHFLRRVQEAIRATLPAPPPDPVPTATPAPEGEEELEVPVQEIGGALFVTPVQESDRTEEPVQETRDAETVTVEIPVTEDKDHPVEGGKESVEAMDVEQEAEPLIPKGAEPVSVETEAEPVWLARLRSVDTILSGEKTVSLHQEFLVRNNHTDVQILKNTKECGRNSITHNATVIANSLMHFGTTSDVFLRENLEWLKRASNWAKFSATASLGLIHYGHEKEALNLMSSYLPRDSTGGSSPYAEGGGLFAIGLIHANHGHGIMDYLSQELKSNSSDVVRHGGCMGLGLAGMGSANLDAYDLLKENLMTRDDAVIGEAAALAMGLVMIGTKSPTAIEDMTNYARETQHEKIQRGLALGISLLMYGHMEEADPLIEDLSRDKDPLLRRSGMFTIAMAYCGSGDNRAIRRLLHVAVSDADNDVRRTAVTSLGFILFRTSEQCPHVVSLLSESFNPHVRAGAAMALGVCCAGTGNKEALSIIEPMLADSVPFVQQAALVSSAMILIQHTSAMCSKTTFYRQHYAKVIADKHEDTLTKFGAIIAQGIIDAGGRNVTITLQSRTGHMNMRTAVGLLVFSQFWFWYPLCLFLGLALTPTAIISLNPDLKMPKLQFHSAAKPSLYGYIPPLEKEKKEEKEKVATAVLSVTAKAKAKAKKAASGGGGGATGGPEAMEVDKKASGEQVMDTSEEATPETQVEGTADAAKTEEGGAKNGGTEAVKAAKSEEDGAENVDSETTKRDEGGAENAGSEVMDTSEGGEVKEGAGEKKAEPEFELLDNPARVLLAQLKVVRLEEGCRYRPLKPVSVGGIVLLSNTNTTTPEDLIEPLIVSVPGKEDEEDEPAAPEPFEWTEDMDV